MSYTLILKPQAEEHLAEWKKSGQVEQLKGDLAGMWSRRINKEARMIYSIEDETVTVTVVSLKGHYGDK